jgi:excinuclease ABC subunit C
MITHAMSEESRHPAAAAAAAPAAAEPPETPPANGDEPKPLSLRDAEVAPPRKSLAEILDGLPVAPGVYIMKDARGKVIYIGKAAVLRNRVRQYFQPATSDIRDFVPLLEGIVADIETVITANEKEALLLENTLIKRHQPRFNVNLKDDKNYLVLRLDPKAEWPRLEVVRRLGDDGAHYFGPYHSATSCREALRVVNRHFQLRTCTDHVLHNRRRPCLQYQIKRCPAPCVLPVPREQYDDQVRDVRLFLDGKSDELMARLQTRMKDAAARTEFEVAAEIRDQIRALEVTLEEQRVVSTDFIDQDVIGFYREGIALELAVMSIRAGKLMGSRTFSFTGQEFPDAELLSSFIGLYYDMGASVPDEVLLPIEIEDATLKAEWLGERRAGLPGARKKKVEVLVPQRGDRRKLVDLANRNAAASFATRRNARADTELALGKLQKRLKLARLPRVIECYDVSHLQGFATVASMVVFVDGRPEKARYRTYKVRAPAAAGSGRHNDDFASMYEVLSRRFRRAKQVDGGEDGAAWKLPDLIVVDGGKGQLAMALAAARDVGVDVRPGVGLPIVALAKERDVIGDEAAANVPTPTPPDGAPAEPPPAAAEPPPTAAEPPSAAAEPPSAAAEPPPTAAEPPSAVAEAPPEPPPAAPRTRGRKAAPKDVGTTRPDRVFLPHAKDAIPIRPNSAEMFVLQALRDEAHRFAVSFHRGQRRRLTLRSALSDIPGIGAGRQRQLLRHFGSIRRVRLATVDELAAVSGISRTVAEAVHAHWAKQPLEAGVVEPQATAEAAAAERPHAEEQAIEAAFADDPTPPAETG